jgi:mono/diheme cytochrome c family protein
MSKSLIGVSLASIGFFGMSVMVLGVWPGRVLEDETRADSPKFPLKLTASQQRGREIYSREGCAYCHTQQIRMTDADMKRFGPSTEAWETQFDYPHLWGTRRIGPDLSRETNLHPEDWHFAHLYDPRSVVPDTIMPAYPALFNNSPDEPRPEARDLLAYLQSLGQGRALAHPTTARETKPPELPTAPPDNDLYQHNCSGCHGQHGDAQNAAVLSPHGASLAAHDYTPQRVAYILWNGERGTAMPAWRDLTPTQLASLVATVRGFRNMETAGPTTQLGADVYKANCAQCHGENGLGDGPARDEIKVPPTNFTQQRPSLSYATDAIRNGVPGTPMAPWTSRLTDEEITAVASFVRGFYR